MICGFLFSIMSKSVFVRSVMKRPFLSVTVNRMFTRVTSRIIRVGSSDSLAALFELGAAGAAFWATITGTRDRNAHRAPSGSNFILLHSIVPTGRIFQIPADMYLDECSQFSESWHRRLVPVAVEHGIGVDLV